MGKCIILMFLTLHGWDPLLGLIPHITWPSIVTNNTKHLVHPQGGPQVGQGSIWANYNYTGVTTQLPFCMTKNQTTAPLCVELKRGLWLAWTPKEEGAKAHIHLFSLGAPGRGTENVTWINVPPKPLCKNFYKWYPTGEEINWQDCYSAYSTNSNLNNSFSFVNWCPHGSAYSSNHTLKWKGTASYLYIESNHSTSWHGGGFVGSQLQHDHWPLQNTMEISCCTSTYRMV